jgi:hypothetical protein
MSRKACQRCKHPSREGLEVWSRGRFCRVPLHRQNAPTMAESNVAASKSTTPIKILLVRRNSLSALRLASTSGRDRAVERRCQGPAKIVTSGCARTAARLPWYSRPPPSPQSGARARWTGGVMSLTQRRRELSSNEAPERFGSEMQ